jgi:hypothetical protein
MKKLTLITVIIISFITTGLLNAQTISLYCEGNDTTGGTNQPTFYKVDAFSATTNIINALDGVYGIYQGSSTFDNNNNPYITPEEKANYNRNRNIQNYTNQDINTESRDIIPNTSPNFYNMSNNASGMYTDNNTTPQNNNLFPNDRQTMKQVGRTWQDYTTPKGAPGRSDNGVRGSGMYQDNKYADNLDFSNVAGAGDINKAMEFTYKNMFGNNSGLNQNDLTEEEQAKREKEYLISRGDSYGMMAANNAIIGLQNFNDVASAKDYEKEYNTMLQESGNTMNKYNANNPTNPFGTYTPNAGMASNYGLVANTPIQDFGTKRASAKYGGTKKKYQEGGEYELSQADIDEIIKNGGEVEYL